MKKKTDYRTPARRQASPSSDVIELGNLRGRRAVTLGLVQAIRRDNDRLCCDLVRFSGIEGKFARDRCRSIEDALRMLERVARLPADPATDYAGTAPRGGGGREGDS